MGEGFGVFFEGDSFVEIEIVELQLELLKNVWIEAPIFPNWVQLLTFLIGTLILFTSFYINMPGKNSWTLPSK